MREPKHNQQKKPLSVLILPPLESVVGVAFAPGKRTTRQQCAVLCATALFAQSMRKSNLSASHAKNRVQAENKGMTPKELACVSAEGRKGWLVTSHFYWLSRCINSQQKHTKFFVFDPTIREASIEKLLFSKTRSQIKKIVFVLSVGRTDDGLVYLGTDKVPGDHWSMAVIDLQFGVLTYCDTLGWPQPREFLPMVVRYTSYLGLTEEEQITLRLAHKPNKEQHICVDGCTNYPLQTCSDVCGIITMVCTAIAALDKELFELLLNSQQANIYLTDPTLYSTYLRHVVLYWISSNHIDMTRVSLKKDLNGFSAPISNSNSQQILKRKIYQETNGFDKVSTPVKRKMSQAKSTACIDSYILDSIDCGTPSSELIQEVVDLFGSEARQSLESLHKDMITCYQDIHFNEAIERVKDDNLSLKSHVDDFLNSYQNANPVIVFKAQGKEMKTLHKEDIIIAIQTPFQKEMMKDYGKKCICVDLTRRRDNEKFYLYTVLVFVEGEVEVPVAWLITNRSDNLVLSIFFKTLSISVGPLRTEIFIGDMASSFYKSWILHFNKPLKRMFPVWEVFHVLSNRLKAFIPNMEAQKKVQSYLNIIPLIKSVEACRHYISALLEVLEPYPDFKDYFKERYVTDSKLEFWACCHCKIPHAKFMPFLTPFDKTLQHLGLHGRDQYFWRADILLHKLLQLSHFLEYKVQVQRSEVRLSKAAKFMNIKHTSAPQGLDIYSSVSGDSWFIKASAESNSYFVIDTGYTECPCEIRCNKCNFCVHRYLCSCPTFLLNPGGCEHTHSVVSFCKMNEALGSNSTLSNSSLSSSSSAARNASGNSLSGPRKTLGAQLNAERLKRQAHKDLSS
ncbi:zinc finger protein [Elysia marginata]|uniref:Zinc finger protein n=1 Tax=Elysia marginata TaxID=1093978 RepID=A0AAV4F292_9GAST|nr:zinc finger protein [Elysia marginata]